MFAWIAVVCLLALIAYLMRLGYLEDERRWEAGYRVLHRGTVVHVNGIPFELDGGVVAFSNPANWELIDGSGMTASGESTSHGHL